MIQSSRLVVAAVLLTASLASADVLHLKTGGKLEGVLTKETPATFTIDVGMGQVSVARASVARVERRDSALSEYRARLARIKSGDVQAYADLARFASDAALRGESQLMWSRVASLDPNNVEAHLALGHVLLEGRYVDEAASYRARGYLYLEGRWMSPEEVALVRDREQRSADDRRVEEARRAARDAEDRARRAEADAARARAEANGGALTGYGLPIVIGGGAVWGGTCRGEGCTTIPAGPPIPSATPAATPVPPARPTRPSGFQPRPIR